MIFLGKINHFKEKLDDLLEKNTSCLGEITWFLGKKYTPPKRKHKKKFKRKTTTKNLAKNSNFT